MPRVVIVAPGELNPALVAAVQEFRGAIYAADGAVTLDAAGRHVETADAAAYHLVLYDAGALGACLRYARRGAGRVRLGGWAVAERLRNGRAGVRLVVAAVELAQALGDREGAATATVRHGSAEILKRLGGVARARYFDASYGCEMEYIEFSLAAMRQAQLDRQRAA